MVRVRASVQKAPDHWPLSQRSQGVIEKGLGLAALGLAAEKETGPRHTSSLARFSQMTRVQGGLVEQQLGSQGSWLLGLAQPLTHSMTFDKSFPSVGLSFLICNMRGLNEIKCL